MFDMSYIFLFKSHILKCYVYFYLHRVISAVLEPVEGPHQYGSPVSPRDGFGKRQCQEMAAHVDLCVLLKEGSTELGSASFHTCSAAFGHAAAAFGRGQRLDNCD